MIFAEKLAFLMQLTTTSNKQLAEAVKVDPSLISRFRGARRGAPKNLNYTKAMADYFARKCEGNYQRIALSEALGRKNLQLQMGTDQLSTILFDWLTDTRDQVGQFLNTFERFSFSDPGGGDGGLAAQPVPRSDANSFAYYGNAGKRGAVSALIDYLLAQARPGTLLVTSDESTDWLFEDRRYLARLQEKVMLLLQRGFRICRIAPALQTADQAFESLSNWLPLYMTGQVESYCYPRLRDELYRRSLVALPDAAALASASTAGQTMARVTLYTQDRRLATAFAGDFQDLLAKCAPLMTTYSTAGGADALLRCIAQFESDKGDRIQQSTSLSAITAPPEQIRQTVRGLPEQEAAAIVKAMRDAQALFRQSLEQYEAIDIHSVATPEEVRAGRVPLSVSYLRREKPLFHTPETYALHLQSILAHMERYGRYRAVLVPRSADTHSLMVKDGRQALLLRPKTPLTVFEVSHPNIVEACREYLLRRIEGDASPLLQRQSAMAELRRLIAQLEKD